MSPFSIVFASLFFVHSFALAKDFSHLSEPKKAAVDAEIRKFLPHYNKASLDILNALFTESETPITYETWLKDMTFKGGKSIEDIFTEHPVNPPVGLDMFQKASLSFAEFLGTVYGGLALQNDMDQKEHLSPDLYYKQISRYLDVIHDQETEKGSETTVVIQSMSYPYCHINIEVFLKKTEPEKVLTSVYENCD